MSKKFSLKFLIITLAATLTISFILPFNHIKAETSSTYTILNKNEVYSIGAPSTQNNSSVYYNHYGVSFDDIEVRATVFYYTGSLSGRTYYYPYFVAEYTSNTKRINYKNDYTENVDFNSLSNTWTLSSYTYNNVQYLLFGVNDTQLPSNYSYSLSDIELVSVSQSDWESNWSSNQKKDYAVRVTFGDLAIDPQPDIQAGNFTYNYYTDFASNTQNTINSMKSNRDTITWDYDFDNSNISALDLRVDIRAIPVNYYSSTEQDLKTLSWNSLNLNVSLYADLGSYHINYNMRKVSYTWEEVVNRISYISNLPDIYNNLVNDWNFKIFNLNNYYYWTGWVYQIRLNTESGDYVGEWQTIYQVSSAPPEEATTTINYYVYGNGMTEPVYQTIQNINNQNNVTNNTWYVNGSPYDINDTSGSNWWQQLLQFITNIVSEILGFLGSIFDSVITGVLEFIKDLGIDFLGLFENLISNIVDLFGNIDLTGNDYTIPEVYTDDLNTYNTWTTGVFNIFFSSGLALFVLIPLILMIVRLVL